MSINHKHNNCLVLNADYTPLSIIGWQKALTWLMKHEHDPKYRHYKFLPGRFYSRG